MAEPSDLRRLIDERAGEDPTFRERHERGVAGLRRTMNDTRCGQVTRRAESGPCAECGRLEEQHAIPWRHWREGEHPFLGQPLAICGHEASEHYWSDYFEDDICSGCNDGKSEVDAWHPYVPARQCQECGGSGRYCAGCRAGPARHHWNPVPCPACTNIAESVE